MTNVKYAKLTIGLIFVWFLFSLTASALHIFTTEPGQPPLPLGLAVLIPIGIFAMWSAVSQPFRQFLLSLNPRTLTIVQAWRIAGFVFLVLYTYGILPGQLALPAGWGDIAIGATAPLVAWKLTNPNHRTGFIVWQLLGITDLVAAVGLGTTAQLINPHGIATGAMTVLPMSLIPTFAVPLFMILHFISIAQARQWQEQPYPRVAE
ncbi:MAG: hypothetical protein QOJ42_355, partial [Acidobacteriaceae bacterium]|nr:hypothetical protein [Acidobacteriaceae bacterium]